MAPSAVPATSASSSSSIQTASVPPPADPLRRELNRAVADEDVKATAKVLEKIYARAQEGTIFPADRQALIDTDLPRALRMADDVCCGSLTELILRILSFLCITTSYHDDLRHYARVTKDELVRNPPTVTPPPSPGGPTLPPPDTTPPDTTPPEGVEAARTAFKQRIETEALQGTALNARLETAIGEAHHSYLIPNESGTPERIDDVPPYFQINSAPEKRAEYAQRLRDKILISKTGQPVSTLDVEVAVGNTKKKVQLSVYIIGQVVAGRGTFLETQAVTQALINQGALAETGFAATPQGIRDMQDEYCVGLDCAGATAQLTARAKNLTTDGMWTGHDAKGNSVTWRIAGANFPTAHGFKRRSDGPRGAMPGDVLLQDAPPDSAFGHALAVRRRFTTSAATWAEGPYVVPAEFFATAPGQQVVCLELVSSNGRWGMDYNPGAGLTSRYYLYNETTDTWCVVNPYMEKPGNFRVADEPGKIQAGEAVPEPFGGIFTPRW